MLRRALIGLVAGGVLASAGCGDDEDERPAGASAEPAATSAAAAPSEGQKIDIADFKYLPADLTVAKGATVSFVNKDKAPHTATAEDGSFDTKRLDRDQTGEITVDKAGTFSYFCEYHRFMEAKITVK